MSKYDVSHVGNFDNLMSEDFNDITIMRSLMTLNPCSDLMAGLSSTIFSNKYL